MDILYTVLAFLLLVGIIVAIHEGGHFIVGRMCGMKMMEFSIGFGPKIFSKRFGKDQTLFTLRAIPMGGFVKPFDQSLVSEEEWNKTSEEDKKRTFSESKRSSKALMVFGGPLANFVLAFFLYLIAMTLVGAKGYEPVVHNISPSSPFATTALQPGDKITEVNYNKVRLHGDVYPALINGMIQGNNVVVSTDKQKDIVVDFSQVNLREVEKNAYKVLGLYFQGNIGDVVISNVSLDSPASIAGLKKDDVLISVDGQKLNEVSKTVELISENPGKELSFVVMRDGELVNLLITPETIVINGEEFGRVGANLNILNTDKPVTVYYGFQEALWGSFVKVWDSSYTTLVSIKKLVTGEFSTKSLSGPLSIADYSGKSAKLGLFHFMIMMATISIAIGVFNLLPIPVLDGGHLLQYGLEWAFGKNIYPKVLYYTQVLGFGMIMGVFSMSIFNDIMKYIF